MVGFNLAVLGAVEHIGATNTGVSSAPPRSCSRSRAEQREPPCSPRRSSSPAPRSSTAPTRASAPLGALLALAALLREVGFTLLAAPLLPRLGPHAGRRLGRLARHRPARTPDAGDLPTPTASEAAAIAYLAVITTALAFVLWFGAVQRLGAARAGLLVGLMPVAAVTVDALLNGRAPSPADLAGTALVATGVALGARPARTPARAGTRASPRASTAPRGREVAGRGVKRGILLSTRAAAPPHLDITCSHEQQRWSSVRRWCWSSPSSSWRHSPRPPPIGSRRLVVVILVLALTSDLFAVSHHGQRISGSFLALVLAMALLGPAPAAAIGIAACRSTRSAPATRPLLLANLATFATFPLVGGLIIDAADVAPAAAFPLLVFGVFLLTNLLNFVMIAGHHALATRTLAAGEFRKIFLPVLPSEVLSAGCARSWRPLRAHRRGGDRADAARAARVPVPAARAAALARTGGAACRAAARRARVDDRDARAARPDDRPPLRRGRPLRPRDGRGARLERRTRSSCTPRRSCTTSASSRSRTRSCSPTPGSPTTSGRRSSAIPRTARGSCAGSTATARSPTSSTPTTSAGTAGLPARLAGEAIPPGARLIAVADTYDVITARDSYRKPISPTDAVAELRRVSGPSSTRGRRGLHRAADRGRPEVRPRRRRRLRGRARVRPARARARPPPNGVIGSRAFRVAARPMKGQARPSRKIPANGALSGAADPTESEEHSWASSSILAAVVTGSPRAARDVRSRDALQARRDQPRGARGRQHRRGARVLRPLLRAAPARRRAGMAFIDMGDQFLALSEGREQGPDHGRHFGLVVDDKAAVRAALEADGRGGRACARDWTSATRGATGSRSSTTATSSSPRRRPCSRHGPRRAREARRGARAVAR